MKIVLNVFFFIVTTLVSSYSFGSEKSRCQTPQRKNDASVKTFPSVKEQREQAKTTHYANQHNSKSDGVAPVALNFN